MDDTKEINSNDSDVIVEKWIPMALMSRKIIANEVKYALPHSEVSNFPELFSDFERIIEKGTTNINSYGISMTTLADVFIKISNDMEISDAQSPQREVMPHRRMSGSSRQSADDEQLISDLPVSLNDVQGDNLIPNVGDFEPKTASIFKVMCLLRIRRLIRNPVSLFFLLVMPIVFVVIGFVIVKYQAVNQTDAQVAFSLESSKACALYL